MKKLTRFSLFVLALCGFTAMNAQVPPTLPPSLSYPADEVLSFVSEDYPEAFTLTLKDDWTIPEGNPSDFRITETEDENRVVLIEDLSWLPISLNSTAELKYFYYLHIDIYCNEETDFSVGLHRHDIPGISAGREQYFPMIKKGAIQPGKWYSIDYSIDDFLDAGWKEDGSIPNVHYLRLGCDVGYWADGFGADYTPYFSDEIYITNFVLYCKEEGAIEPECLDGCVREETSISTGKEDVAFNAYISNGTLNFNSVEKINGLSVYDVAGKLIASFNVNNTTGNVAVSDLASGVYIVSADLANGGVANQRIVK